MKISTRLTSSLEKCFPSDEITAFAPLSERTVLGGECLSVQLLMRYEPPVKKDEVRVCVRTEGDVAFRIREVVAVPNHLPAYADHCDGNYLRLDLLRRYGYLEMLESNIRDYFTYMAERTGTLWEYDRPEASCNHGFASFLAILLQADCDFYFAAKD